MNKLIDEISCSCFSEILFEVSEDLRGFKNETVCIYLLIKLHTPTFPNFKKAKEK